MMYASFGLVRGKEWAFPLFLDRGLARSKHAYGNELGSCKFQLKFQSTTGLFRCVAYFIIAWMLF